MYFLSIDNRENCVKEDSACFNTAFASTIFSDIRCVVKNHRSPTAICQHCPTFVSIVVYLNFAKK